MSGRVFDKVNLKTFQQHLNKQQYLIPPYSPFVSFEKLNNGYINECLSKPTKLLSFLEKLYINNDEEDYASSDLWYQLVVRLIKRQFKKRDFPLAELRNVLEEAAKAKKTWDKNKFGMLSISYLNKIAFGDSTTYYQDLYSSFMVTFCSRLDEAVQNKELFNPHLHLMGCRDFETWKKIGFALGKDMSKYSRKDFEVFEVSEKGKKIKWGDFGERFQPRKEILDGKPLGYELLILSECESQWKSGVGQIFFSLSNARFSEENVVPHLKLNTFKNVRKGVIGEEEDVVRKWIKGCDSNLLKKLDEFVQGNSEPDNELFGFLASFNREDGQDNLKKGLERFVENYKEYECPVWGVDLVGDEDKYRNVSIILGNPEVTKRILDEGLTVKEHIGEVKDFLEDPRTEEAIQQIEDYDKPQSIMIGHSLIFLGKKKLPNAFCDVAMTSNRYILGLKTQEHPLMDYVKYYSKQNNKPTQFPDNLSFGDDDPGILKIEPFSHSSEERRLEFYGVAAEIARFFEEGHPYLDPIVIPNNGKRAKTRAREEKS